MRLKKTLRDEDEVMSVTIKMNDSVQHAGPWENMTSHISLL